MGQITFEQAREMAMTANADLRANDPRFSYSVYLATLDSTHIVENAFLCRYGDYIVLFAEHHKPMVYPDDEVISAFEFKKLRVLKDHRIC